jgi:hypothetical protein
MEITTWFISLQRMKSLIVRTIVMCYEWNWSLRSDPRRRFSFDEDGIGAVQNWLKMRPKKTLFYDEIKK